MRIAGAALSVIGAGLSIGMVYLLIVVADAMHPSGGAERASFTGTPQEATLVFAILGAVLAFGMTSLVTGVWQLLVGRRNLLLSGIVLLMGLATVVFVVLFQLESR